MATGFLLWGGIHGPLPQAAIAGTGAAVRIFGPKVRENVAANATVNAAGTILTDTDQGFVAAGVAVGDRLRVVLIDDQPYEVTLTAVGVTTLTFAAGTIPPSASGLSVKSYEVGDPNRLAHPATKTITVSDKQGAAANVYVGGSSVSSVSFVLEVKPGDPAAVIDVQNGGIEKWYVNSAVGTTAYVSQVG